MTGKPAVNFPIADQLPIDATPYETSLKLDLGFVIKTALKIASIECYAEALETADLDLPQEHRADANRHVILRRGSAPVPLSPLVTTHV